MKALFYYFETSSLNDATSYYVNIIKKGLERVGISLVYTQNLKDLSDADIVLTITVRSFIKARRANTKAKTIFWSQGVGPEEAIMAGKSFRNVYRYICRWILTKYALAKADVVFLVSEMMRTYYVNRYHFVNNNCIIMPCYNLPLSEYFDENQYKRPTFVYAGNASVWQGVDLMLDVYSIVEKSIPDAQLMLLSKNKNEFIRKIRERGIRNYEIKYVSMTELQDELHKYKYGFIIRDNNIVNRVATPTKMNSYLSNYLIPIFSDTVDDFKRYIKLEEFSLMATYPLDANAIANQIIDFERNISDFSTYYNKVGNVFKNHYNDDVYIEKFVEIMNKII